MRATRTRAKIAAWLDARSAKTASQTLKSKFYRASRAIYPVAKLKRKVPAGMKFFGALKPGEMVVLGKDGKLLYQGAERRSALSRRVGERRKNLRRDDTGKQTIKY